MAVARIPERNLSGSNPDADHGIDNRLALTSFNPSHTVEDYGAWSTW